MSSKITSISLSEPIEVHRKRTRIRIHTLVASSDSSKVINSDDAKYINQERVQEKMKEFIMHRKNMQSWANTLHDCLKGFGISSQKCRAIARHRTLHYLEMIQDGIDCDVFTMYPHIFTVKEAIHVYNSYLRHEHSDYNAFCRKLTSRDLSRKQRYQEWQSFSQEGYGRYINKCIRLNGCF